MTKLLGSRLLICLVRSVQCLGYAGASSSTVRTVFCPGAAFVRTVSTSLPKHPGWFRPGPKKAAAGQDSTGKLAGWCEISRQNAYHSGRGFVRRVGVACWGNGFATEAAIGLVHGLFLAVAKRVFAQTTAVNH